MARSRPPRILRLSEYRWRARRRKAVLAGTVFVGVFAAGMLATAGRPLVDAAVASLPSPGNFASKIEADAGGETFSCTVASVTDGDTLRCVEQGTDGRAIRVRISGISAREWDNSCSPGHPCPTASAEASTAALERLAGGEVLSCRAVGTTYSRVAAFCENGRGVDLSCAMVQGGYAAKWERYWGDHGCE